MLPPRPKNLNLFTIHFPLPSIISILHRISGFILFLLVPFALWMLQYSLTLSGFEVLYRWFGYFWIKLFCLALFVPFCFHLVAGIRHLLMDIHIGDELKSGRASSMIVFAVTIVLIIVAGIWLW
jgi:succinate dehydrogenase / fumarate reductase cytochrome b subunit